MTDRQNAIKTFLDANGWGGAGREPLVADASFRRYERLTLSGHRRMLMDAPPPNERVDEFITIAQHLDYLGFSTPKIYAQDINRGLLIIEDLGNETFTNVLLAEEKNEAILYKLAVDVLIELHSFSLKLILPPNTKTYSIERLLEESQLLCDWTWGALFGNKPEAKVINSYQAAWKETLSPFINTDKTLVLRDYHVDNLMVLKNRSGIARCGLLDFQDAVIGHRAYDLMSLLEDARRDISSNIKETMLERYFNAFPSLEREPFSAAFAVFAAQRHAKVIGIFTRLCMRDGKTVYLKYIPRVWRLLERALSHPSLAPVANWFDLHIPTEKRIAPSLIKMKYFTYLQAHSKL
jgi:aminoglycoside/choline kinase family phosphotransferase